MKNPGKSSKQPTSSGGGGGGAGVCQDLPSRELTAYKRMLKCYEQKQFKQGLKLSKQILSNPKCSEHADTLAARGLNLLGLGKVLEAEESVRRGLKNNLRSFPCWNALALILKDLRKFEESIKCLRNCLKLQPDNFEVLRNLSVLTVHIGDLDCYRETRFNIFQQKPTQRASWGGLALSYHLQGELDMSLKILEEYRKSQSNQTRDMVGQLMKSMFNKKTEYDYEHSEILKYHIKVLMETGALQEALNLLQSNRSILKDKDFADESEAKLLASLGRRSETVAILETIIRHNPHRTDPYQQMIDARELNTEEEILAYLKEMSDIYPHSDTPVILSLKYATEDNFRELCQQYLKQKVQKRNPSAMRRLKPFYSCSLKGGLIGEVLDSLDISVETTWKLYYTSIHLKYIHSYRQALEKINECVEKEPDEVDFYLLKGNLLKHLEHHEEAVEAVSTAFDLDPTDRCVGSKLAKYQLTAGRIGESIKTMGKFTKPGEKPLDYLEEIQCTWFLLRLAQTYSRQGKLGDCLVYCHKLEDIYQSMDDDLLDFHQYSLTKLRLSAYYDVLVQRKNVRKHPHYIGAAFLAVESYIKLFDSLKHEDKSRTTAEKKKSKEKEKEKEKKKGGKEKNSLPSKEKYSAEQIEKVSDPLNQCKNFLNHLQDIAKENPRTHELAARVNLRRGRVLLTLRALLKMKKSNGSETVLVELEDDLKRFIQNNQVDERLKNIVDMHIDNK